MRREKSSQDLLETLGSQQMKLLYHLPCGWWKSIWVELKAMEWARGCRLGPRGHELLWTLYPAPSKGAGDHVLHCRLSPVIQIYSLKEVNQTSLPCFTCTRS